MYNYFFKRLFDILVATIFLILLSPIFILIALLLSIANRGKVFFVQARPGLHEKTFNLIKFKTMNDKTNYSGELLPDRDRITKVGRFLRKTSLDELPELLNILSGKMSLVGPRPLLIKYLPYYTETEKKRHSIRPGLTGLAQVKGRNNLKWDDKLALDVFYVKNISLYLDIKIIFLTFLALFRTGEILDAAPEGSLDSLRKSHK